MYNNLTPPFIIREAGVIANEVPKIHVRQATVEDYLITFPVDKFRIPLKLFGIVLYFETRKPIMQQVEEC